MLMLMMMMLVIFEYLYLREGIIPVVDFKVSVVPPSGPVPSLQEVDAAPQKSASLSPAVVRTPSAQPAVEKQLSWIPNTVRRIYS